MCGTTSKHKMRRVKPPSSADHHCCGSVFRRLSQETHQLHAAAISHSFCCATTSYKNTHTINIAKTSLTTCSFQYHISSDFTFLNTNMLDNHLAATSIALAKLRLTGWHMCQTKDMWGQYTSQYG